MTARMIVFPAAALVFRVFAATGDDCKVAAMIHYATLAGVRTVRNEGAK